MIYTVKADDAKSINLAPKTIHEEVMQNVAMIISTPQFSVPLARGLGLQQRFLDKPHNIAITIAISEIMDAIEAYEPRAKIMDIRLESGNKEGKFIPVIDLEVRTSG